MMTLQQKRNFLNKELSKIKNLELQSWLNEASKNIAFSYVLNGIYCGREGSIKEELGGDCKGLYLTMGWYTVSTIPKVEYAYVS